MLQPDIVKRVYNYCNTCNLVNVVYSKTNMYIFKKMILHSILTIHLDENYTLSVLKVNVI